MAADTFNDNEEFQTHRSSDTHGQAALLLVESLIHGLISRNVMTVADAVDILDTAAEVTIDGAADQGHSPAQLRRSMDLLNAISTSLRRDIPGA